MSKIVSLDRIKQRIAVTGDNKIAGINNPEARITHFSWLKYGREIAIAL